MCPQSLLFNFYFMFKEDSLVILCTFDETSMFDFDMPAVPESYEFICLQLLMGQDLKLATWQPWQQD